MEAGGTMGFPWRAESDHRGRDDVQVRSAAPDRRGDRLLRGSANPVRSTRSGAGPARGTRLEISRARYRCLGGQDAYREPPAGAREEGDPGTSSEGQGAGDRWALRGNQGTDGRRLRHRFLSGLWLATVSARLAWSGRAFASRPGCDRRSRAWKVR